MTFPIPPPMQVYRDGWSIFDLLPRRWRQSRWSDLHIHPDIENLKMMTFDEFHNALRVLLNLDRVELERFLVLRKGDHPGWARFQENPYRFFIKADTETAKNLFVLMQQRMTNRPVPQEAIDVGVSPMESING